MSNLPVPDVAVVQKPKHTMLPLLVALFVISYGILTMLVVEQGRTIESQRGLIMDLFNDSNELIHLKGKLAQQHLPAKPNNGKSQSQAQAPATQAPRAQGQTVPGREDQNRTKVSDKSPNSRKAHADKPPKAQDDDPDLRRMNVSI